ncbi:MAG: cell division protein FtsB [Pseudomonadota bacterium]
MNKLICFTLIIIFLVLQYRLWFGEGNVWYMLRLENKISAQKNENDKLQARNQRLIAEIKDLKSGNQGIIERARSELGMIKPGEVFYQFVKPPAAVSHQATTGQFNADK